MYGNQIRPGGFNILPPVVKNLIIINALAFLAYYSFAVSFGIDLNAKLGLHYVGSDKFAPYQFVTYMFMHGGFGHIFFNMFALWMFGNTLENYWGPKRFFIYYFVTGIGAALFYQGVQYIEAQTIIHNLKAIGLGTEQISEIVTLGKYNPAILQSISKTELFKLYSIYNTPTVGASGAVFGLLLAFGMTFPNAVIYLYFAIPIKAKYFVILYGAFELWSGLANNPQDNVAHFAHLGGMLFGFILIKMWQKNSSSWM